MKEWGMEGASPVATPLVKEELSGEGGDVLMESKEATRYRRAAAQVNYMALDNPFLGFAVKELSRKMAKPCVDDDEQVKRVIRFLIGCPGAVYQYLWQDRPSGVYIQIRIGQDVLRQGALRAVGQWCSAST